MYIICVCLYVSVCITHLHRSLSQCVIVALERVEQRGSSAALLPGHIGGGHPRGVQSPVRDWRPTQLRYSKSSGSSYESVSCTRAGALRRGADPSMFIVGNRMLFTDGISTACVLLILLLLVIRAILEHLLSVDTRLPIQPRPPGREQEVLLGQQR
jgi:hypothetical protein